MVGTVAGVRARRFERRMSKQENPASQGPLSSLLAACSVQLCSTGRAERPESEQVLPASRSRDRQEILRIEQRAEELGHLRHLIKANPLPDGGRRLSRSSAGSDKSVFSEDY
jgi:hypothetical protein